jgi:PAP2 superfamily
MATSAHTHPPFVRRVSQVPPFVREIAIAIAAYLVYEAARLVGAGSYPTALAHAHDIVALERDLHLDVEGGVQRAFLDSPLLHVLNYVYVAAQNLVLPASLVLLYRVNRATYRVLRNTLLATWLLALPVYALYPAAPPRLSGLGIVDTVSAAR